MRPFLLIFLLPLTALAAEVNITNIPASTRIIGTDFLLGQTNGANGATRRTRVDILQTNLFAGERTNLSVRVKDLSFALTAADGTVYMILTPSGTFLITNGVTIDGLSILDGGTFTGLAGETVISSGASFGGNVNIGAGPKITLIAADGSGSAASGGFSWDDTGTVYIGAGAVTLASGGSVTAVGDVSSTSGIFHGDGSGLSNVTAVASADSWIPNTAYEMWYEPFPGGTTAGGQLGMMGWTGLSSGAGGGSVTISNAPNHWGTAAITTSGSANSIHAIFNSSVVNAKPTVPPLNATTGWTNRIIWRLNGTNDVKCYMVLQAGNFTQSALEAGIGLLINTNSTFPQGTTSTGSSVSVTNIGNQSVVSGQWYTSYVWSASSGVISFQHVTPAGASAEATLDDNVPTSALTPAFGLVKTATTAACSLEVDEWMLMMTRQ